MFYFKVLNYKTFILQIVSFSSVIKLIIRHNAQHHSRPNSTIMRGFVKGHRVHAVVMLPARYRHFMSLTTRPCASSNWIRFRLPSDQNGTASL